MSKYPMVFAAALLPATVWAQAAVDLNTARQRVKIALWGSEVLKGLDITVEARAGKLSLFGNVDYPHVQQRALEIARAASGGVEITDDLRVRSYVRRTWVSATDRDIETKLFDELQKRNLTAPTLAVAHGRVVFTGRAQSLDQMFRLSEAAASVPGVRAVKNRMTTFGLTAGELSGDAGAGAATVVSGVALFDRDGSDEFDILSRNNGRLPETSVSGLGGKVAELERQVVQLAEDRDRAIADAKRLDGERRAALDDVKRLDAERNQLALIKLDLEQKLLAAQTERDRLNTENARLSTELSDIKKSQPKFPDSKGGNAQQQLEATLLRNLYDRFGERVMERVGVEVDAQRTVTLRGRVPTEQDRAGLVGAVKAMVWVRGVDDQLKVGRFPGGGFPAVKDPRQLEQLVRTRLSERLGDAGIREVTVESSDQLIVTLSGRVDNSQARDAAVVAANQVPGVSGVVNALFVGPALPQRGPKEDLDEYVERCLELITGALPRDETRNLRWSVSDGGKTIRLRGDTRSQEVKRNLPLQAGRIPGVERVRDEIEIKP